MIMNSIDQSIELSKTNNKGTVEMIGETYAGLVQFLTGIASTDKKEWALSIGYLLQRMRGGQFLKTLMQEINQYREKGKIKEDYFNTDQGTTCTQELLDFIDKDSPDEIRFAAMKALFMVSACETLTTRTDVLPQQLMRICRSLSSAEVLILKASFEMLRKGEIKESMGGGVLGTTHHWVSGVLVKTGLKYDDIIKLNEKTLMEKRLLTQTHYKDGSSFYMSEYYRLTVLGYYLCKYIEEYNIMNESEKNK